jgi:hypothetical protein
VNQIKITLQSEEPYFLPSIDFFLEPKSVDTLYMTIFDSSRIPEDKMTDNVQSQICNALWLLHKIMVQEHISMS